MIVICIYHGGVVKPFDCSHFALSSCDGAHSDTCAFLHKEIGPMARSVNKSASLLCFFLGGLLWRGYNIRNLLRRSFRYQAFRLAPAPGERKTRFEESELHAWQWLMQWSDRPPLEQVPAQFRELVQKAGPVSWLDSLVGSFVVVGWFVRGGLVRSSRAAGGVRAPRFGHVPSAARCVGWFMLGWFVRGGWRTGCVCRALATSRLLLGVLVGSCWVGSFVVGGGRGTCAALWPRPVCCSVCWLVRVGLVRSWWVADGVRVPRFGHVPSAARCVGWFVLGWFVRGGWRTGCVCRALATSRLLLGWFVSWWVGSFVAGCGQGACAALWPRPVCCSAGSFRGGFVRSCRRLRAGCAALWPRPVCCSVCWLVRVVVEFCLCQAVQLPPEPPVKQDQLVVQPVPGPQDQTAAV